jgi:[histone H3]-lysine36 N-trimethyltransferase
LKCVWQLTAVIAEKEKKSSSYKEGRLDSLSDEKKAKMKKFAKEYVVKIVRKLDKLKRKPSSSSHADKQPSRGDSLGSSAREADDAIDVDMDENLENDDSDAEPSPDEPKSAITEAPALSSRPASAVDPRIRRRREGSGWDETYER